MLWNNLVSVRPNCFIFTGYLIKMKSNRQSEPPPPHHYIFAKVKSCKVWPDFSDLGKRNMLMLSKELKLLDKTQKRRKSKHFFYVYLYMLHTYNLCDFVVACWLLSFKISLGNKIKLSNCLDPDNSVGPDLDPNCFQILSADDKSCC